MNSHDVRRLKVCRECSQIGMYRPRNPEVPWPLVVQVENGEFAHPGCMRTKAILKLPDTELGAIRLSDVSRRTMQAILKRRSA